MALLVNPYPYRVCPYDRELSHPLGRESFHCSTGTGQGAMRGGAYLKTFTLVIAATNKESSGGRHHWREGNGWCSDDRWSCEDRPGEDWGGSELILGTANNGFHSRLDNGLGSDSEIAIGVVLALTAISPKAEIFRAAEFARAVSKKETE
ncbi:hypothetical protein MRX96_040945 [Rhipicephalus microplus]